MKKASITKGVIFDSDRVKVDLLFESESNKELRISLAKGQEMKAHKAPFPISVELFSGAVNFGVEQQNFQLEKGDLLSLEANVVHDLHATEDSIIRLSIHKQDAVTRVEKVASS